MPSPLRLALAVAISLAAIAPGAAQAFSAHGSARQVYATGVPSKAQIALLNNAGRKVATKRADGLGGVLFRDVSPGSGYRVRIVKGGGKSGPLTVFSNRAAPPSTDIYNQTLPTSGYGYMTTRDGTKLAIDVHPPTDVSSAIPLGIHLPRGGAPTTPSPTLIEYSGYGYANPDGPVNGIAILANLMGFTVVDVNMRGTGCSSGAFDFFEPLQNLDGYDVIETVARQPWVLNHKVGMMGISYGGISQLFTAQLRPPSLAAISPLSVIDQTATTLYPGGILNTGFAVAWAKERQQEAKPAGPHSGQPYAYKQIQSGDQICKQNQVLHGEAANLMKKIRENDHYIRKVADPLSPVTFVHKINVPVYMACQFTDEQTGGHCPTLAEHMTGTTRKWFTFTNGTHVDSLDPQTFNRWYDFLQIYVARQSPLAGNPAPYRAGGPVVYQEAMGIPGQTYPPDPIQNQVTYDSAKSAFEALPSIRVLFDNGAGGNMPGAPEPGFEQSFSRFPVPGTSARSFFLSRGGKLASNAPGKAGTNSFTWNAHARPLSDFSGDTAGGTNGLWTATPPYKWVSPPKGSAVSYVTPPLTSNTTAIGAGAVNVWVRASKPVVDLQATVTEVRPDGKETFAQGGWLRGNERKLTKGSTSLEPALTLRKGDRSPLSSKKYVKATIPLYYEGHVYRAGSRIRVYISAPNGDQPIWSFSEPKPSKGKANVSVAFSKSRPSRLVLPVVAGVNVPTGLPPCPGLRGEPCRDYKPYTNRK